MALRKVQSGAIADNAITTSKIASGAVTAADLNSDVNNVINNVTVNTVFTGNSITIPAGTTAERPASANVGMIRYNTTTGLVEQYNATGWQGIDSPPTASSYSGIINENTNSTITVNGTNFKVGSVIYIEGAAVSGISRALTTTYVSSTQLTAATNATSVNYTGNAAFDIKVINPSGLSATLSPAGTIDRDPIWSTSAGTLATIADEYGSYSPIATVSASDPDGTSITYSISTGALPSNVTLNSSNGQISGNPGNVSSSTTYSFDVTATSNTQSVPRSFNIIVNPAPDGTSSARAATSATAIKSLTGTTTDGLYWINLPTVGATQVYCDMNTSSGGWMHIATFSDNNESRGSASGTTQQSGGNHPWGAPLMPAQNAGIWQDTTTLGTQSFTSDFKSSAWAYYPMTQMLMKDSGASLRNLWYTNSISSQTMSAFWAARSWAAGGSENSDAAYSGGRVYGVNITNFGVNDPVFQSSSRTTILFKFGEYDGIQDGNKDRSMIAAHRSNGADGVDAPGGIGCFTSHDASQGGPVQYYRDIVPYAQMADEPPSTITSGPYNYTFWIR